MNGNENNSAVSDSLEIGDLSDREIISKEDE
jgi:hypothetical protein